jgi:hypothetical protein
MDDVKVVEFAGCHKGSDTSVNLTAIVGHDDKTRADNRK